MLVSNDYFQNLNNKELIDYLMTNRLNLSGSAVFVKGQSLISKAISKVTRKGCKEDFIPSHVGSLYLENGFIKQFDMRPPKGQSCDFFEYIRNTKDKFILVTRDFELDTTRFNYEIKSYIGKKYGYLSALQAGFKLIYFPLGVHCSEIHLKLLKNQGLFPEESPNASTPESLYHLLKGDKNE